MEPVIVTGPPITAAETVSPDEDDCGEADPESGLSAPAEQDSGLALEEAASFVKDSFRGKVEDLIWEKGVDGCAEFLAVEIQRTVFDKALGLWTAQEGEALAQLPEDLLALKEQVHEQIGSLVTGLFADPDSAAAVVAGSIAQYTPIEFIDRRLGGMALGVEIAGVALCTLSGNVAGALACIKALTHDLIHRALVQAIKELLTPRPVEVPDDGELLLRERRDVGAHGGQSVERPTVGDGVNASAQIASAPIAWVVGRAPLTGGAGMVSVARIAGQAAEVATGPADPASPAEQGSQHNVKGRRLPEPGPYRQGPPDPRQWAALDDPRHEAVDGGSADAGMTHPAAGRWSPVIREGGNIAGVTAGGSGPGQDQPGVTAARRYLTYVRLRLYYESAQTDTQPGSDDGQPVTLARLVVVRDSRRFPELVGTDPAQIADFVARELAKEGTRRAWQVRDAGGAEAFDVAAASARALLASLGRTIVGLAPDLGLPGLVIEPIDADSAIGQFSGKDGRLVEIIGISSQEAGKPMLQALAAGAPVHDRFWAMILANLLS